MRILCLFAISAWACAQVQHPQLGKMLDANGAVRTVYGIASSVTLGDAEMDKVLSSGCSKTFCLAKTDAAIVSASGMVSAPRGPALFAFDGANAWIWFPASRQLAQWNNAQTAPDSRGSISSIEPRPPGAVSSDVFAEVLSIGATAGSVQFAVRRSTGIWIVNQDGSVASALPRDASAVVLIPGGAVYAKRNGIVIHDLELPLEGVTAFSWMSTSYLEVRAGGLNYALRIDPGRETLFQLPGVQQ
jgi:hypothetical protein